MSRWLPLHKLIPPFNQKWIGILALFYICMVIPAAGLTQTVELPISIDYPLLRTLTIHSAFTGPDETARLLTAEDGCTTVTVADPQFAPHNDLVRLEVFVDLRAGKSFGTHCFMPISWQGYAVLFQQPKIDTDTWQLSFKTVDSIILDRHHQPAKIAAILWKLMESWVYPYLNQIRIDLTPPVADLKHILLPMFPSKNINHTQKLLDSMRPGNIRTGPDQVRINILIDAAAPGPAPDNAHQPTDRLSDNELDQFIRVWETWDALLVQMISSLTGKSLSDADRQTLLETLLDTRHRFSAGLAGDPMDKDFVKEQFLWAWKQMASIFRKNLSETTSKQSLGYLAFFTASDALAALDKLGPSFGVEISREGLIRLARLLGGSAESLEYRPETDNQLREIFGFDPIDNSSDDMDEPLPLLHPDDADKTHFGLGPFLNYLISPRLAMAGEKKITIDQLKPWIVPKSDVNDYLERVKKVLNKTAATVILNKKIPDDYEKLYEKIIYSTAWQESCFRQFHTKKNKLVYLRSYNGSSVGLMQINERVWRGIYNLNRLRWDIHYNANAGCEIAATYFRRYVLKRMSQIESLNKTAIAGIVYAMYNGGPSQFNKFLVRLKNNQFHLSDRLFKEKYDWVVNNQWEFINRCLLVG